MTIEEFEKELQHGASDSKVHVEEEKKNMFRVKRHDSNGLVLGSSYAGTVRVYIDEQLIFSLVPPRKDGVNCWYVDFEGDITAVTASSLHVYIGMLKVANKFMKEHEDEEIKR